MPYAGGTEDHFQWHVDTPRERTVGSFVVCLGVAARDGEDGSTWSWLSPEDSLKAGGLELLLPKAPPVESAESVPAPTTVPNSEASASKAKRQRVLPRGATLTTVMHGDQTVPIVRVATGAVGFYRNVHHRVPPLAQHEGLPPVKDMVRFSMTFRVCLTKEVQLDAMAPESKDADADFGDRGGESDSDSEATCDSKVDMEEEVRRRIRCVRMMEVLASYILNNDTGIGILGQARYSYYEHSANFLKQCDLGLEALMEYMRLHNIPFVKNLEYTWAKTYTTDFDGGRDGSYERNEYADKRTLAKEVFGEQKDPLPVPTMQQVTETLKLACRALAPGGEERAPPLLFPSTKKHMDFEAFRYVPLKACDMSKETLSSACYTGNECEDGEERVTYTTTGVFIPPSEELRTWYASVRRGRDNEEAV